MDARTKPTLCPLLPLVGLGILLTSSLAQAVPTSLNVVPTADVAGAGKYMFQLEADGHATPCSQGTQVWLLTAFGVGNRLEVGANRAEGPGLSRWFADAKLQLVPEGSCMPALAVGATDITRRGEDSIWYAVATKGIGPVRATVGYQRDCASRLLLGGAYSLSDKLTLQSDWSSGPLGACTLGLCQDIGHGRCLLLYYSRNNSSDGDSFTGLNLTWNCEWRHPKHTVAP